MIPYPQSYWGRRSRMGSSTGRLFRVTTWGESHGPAVGAVLAWILYKVIVEGDLDFSDDVEEIVDATTT
jgi:hypothetical protein